MHELFQLTQATVAYNQLQSGVSIKIMLIIIVTAAPPAWQAHCACLGKAARATHLACSKINAFSGKLPLSKL
jgi:hypothetical protein